MVLGLLAGPAALASGAAGSAAPAPLAPFPARTVDFIGYGNGHGHGMGQWGAFGYAAVDHETYKWILAHYYGGTRLSSKGNLTSKDPLVRVDLNENDGHPVVVTSPSPFSFGGHSFRAGQAARAVLSAGRWTLSEAAGCFVESLDASRRRSREPGRQAGVAPAFSNRQAGSHDL